MAIRAIATYYFAAEVNGAYEPNDKINTANTVDILVIGGGLIAIGVLSGSSILLACGITYAVASGSNILAIYFLAKRDGKTGQAILWRHTPLAIPCFGNDKPAAPAGLPAAAAVAAASAGAKAA